ncbi:glycosyltransferase family 2 protein [Faecalibaculum rodentium]|uniref:glycosyltransferase family 2 protein n=1 Tax=Faecalibaculum rodentium TaxID=1702221 RepID=UPI00266F82E0|nr:glycosyltransferase family 2 protein [Faecalibaculum rodentium]
MQFSVILVSYNASKDALEKTLRSILKQQGLSFEIIFADDGSLHYPKDDLITLCRKYNFINYKFSDNSENVGTVRNLIRALELTSGEFIKGIGAGDYFESKHLLRDVYHGMKSGNYFISYTKMNAYYVENNKEIVVPKKFPINNYLYRYELTQLMKVNQIVYQDNISGATLFYERNVFLQYLSMVSGKVIYCEDLIQNLYTLDGYPTLYIENQVIKYEYGMGISTSKEANKRFSKDFDAFQQILSIRYPQNNLVQNRGLRSKVLRDGNALSKAIFVIENKPLITLSKFLIKSFRG